MRDPLHRWVPDYPETFGDLAANVGEQLGMSMDDEQKDILNAIFAEDEPGVPTCFEVGVVAPRQNLKTSTLEIAALTDVFVLGEELHVWTAHLFPTARKTFEHMVGLIAANDDFKRRCVWPPPSSHGEEAIELLTGPTIEFKARSKGGGRGFSDVAKVTLDEALFLSDSELGALLPTMATNPAAQVRYGSSAGFTTSEALRAIRDRGRKGRDPRLAYFEHGAPRVKCEQKDCDHNRINPPPGCALDREELWRRANPALGRRITISFLRSMRRSLPPAEFSREFLSWWDEPVEVADRAIAPNVWKAQQDPSSRPLDPVALGIEVSPQRHVSLVAAGWRPDGRWHGEVITTGRGTGWLIDVLLRVIDKVDPAVLVIDSAGRAGSLIPDIEAAGLEVTVTSAAQRARADRGLVDDLEQDRGRIAPGSPLDNAVEAATWRDMPGGGQAFDRRHVTSDISSLVGLSLARFGLLTAEPPAKPGAPPEAIPTAERSDTAREVDLLSTGF